jgi:hypothetical protein
LIRNISRYAGYVRGCKDKPLPALYDVTWRDQFCNSVSISLRTLWRKEKSPPPPGIKPRFSGCTDRSLVTILTVLCTTLHCKTSLRFCTPYIFRSFKRYEVLNNYTHHTVTMWPEIKLNNIKTLNFHFIENTVSPLRRQIGQCCFGK